MASPQSAATAASEAQAAQVGLTAVIGADLTRAIATIDVADVDGSMPRFFALVTALIHRYGQASATLAARYYLAQRIAAGLGALHVKPAPLPPVPQIAATLGWATTPLRETGNLATTEANVKGAVDRLVLDVGRRTLVDAVQTDRRAKGWARITSPGACSFCRLMATRGAVYKSEDTAGRDANTQFVGEGEFKFHNHCHCHIEPVFGIYEMTAQAREDLALYRKVTEGLSGAQARNAFRQVIEGREVTGTAGHGGKTGHAARAPRKVDVSPDVARKLIGQFEQSIQTMSQHKGTDQAIEAARKRIAELQTLL